MRRFLILLAGCLALCALTAPALASVYRSDYGYTIEIPDGWTVMTREYTSGALEDLPDALGLDMFVSRDRAGTLSVLIYPSSGASTEELAELVGRVEGASDYEVYGVRDVGGRSWYCLSCTWSGEKAYQAFCADGSELYAFTFSGIADSGLIRSVLSSFRK